MHFILLTIFYENVYRNSYVNFVTIVLCYKILKTNKFKTYVLEAN